MVNYVKDLGVFFDRKLTFDMHVSYLIKNGNKALGKIKSFKKLLNLHCMIKLYKTLV